MGISWGSHGNLSAGELKTGYLEKRVGEHSGRQSVPLGESFKWQKRYFVLTEPKGMLYYFKSADDPPNYRGVINLRSAPCLNDLNNCLSTHQFR